MHYNNWERSVKMWTITVTAVPSMCMPRSCGTAIIDKWKKHIREVIIDSTSEYGCLLDVDIKFDGEFVIFVLRKNTEDNHTPCELMERISKDFNGSNGFICAEVNATLERNSNGAKGIFKTATA